MSKIITAGAVSLLALAATDALAQQETASGEALTGEAAFGGWEQDSPGVRRHFTVDDLAEPGATASAQNMAEPVTRPDDVTPQVPEGFTAELVAEGLENPRTLTFAPNGDLFVANSEANEVLVYRFDGEGAEPSEEGVFASEGLNQPYGIAFYPPGDSPEWVYVANSDGLVRFPYSDGDMEASGAPETILSDIPASHHWTRDVVFSPDGGTMYYSVGSGSNVAEEVPDEPEGGLDAWTQDQPAGAIWGSEEGRAAVLAFNPDGSDMRIHATGVRNCSGMALHPETNEVWCAVNERDGLGNNVPFDYVSSIEEGGFYGWPWYYIGGNEDPRHAGERPDLAEQVVVPDVLIQPHSAPLNLAFYTSESWGAEYQGDAFVTLHGSWNREPRTGYKVVRLEFENGEATGVYEDFVTGFLTEDGSVWGRPVGVAVSDDGSLFVSEDGSGTIWRISRQ